MSRVPRVRWGAPGWFGTVRWPGVLGWLLCAGGLVVAAPGRAGAWGRDGHRIVGALASPLLSPAARAESRRLLRGLELEDVAFWADEVKGNPAFHWAYPLHYANVPEGSAHFEERRDCVDPPGCVVGAIRRYRRILADRRASTAARAEALRFLVHFVGDVHQPMHVAHASDRGGNDVAVTFSGMPTNLHRVWDSLLLARRGLWWKAHARDIATRGVRWVVPATGGDPARWADESYGVAVGFGYRVPAGGVLGKAYSDRAVGLAEERLWAAGGRLAALLEPALLSGRPPRSLDAGGAEGGLGGGGSWDPARRSRGCGVVPAGAGGGSGGPAWPGLLLGLALVWRRGGSAGRTGALTRRRSGRARGRAW